MAQFLGEIYSVNFPCTSIFGCANDVHNFRSLIYFKGEKRAQKPR